MNSVQALEHPCQAERAEESPRQRTLALPHFCKRGSDRRGRVLVRGQRQTEARLKQYKNSLQNGGSFLFFPQKPRLRAQRSPNNPADTERGYRFIPTDTTQHDFFR